MKESFSILVPMTVDAYAVLTPEVLIAYGRVGQCHVELVMLRAEAVRQGLLEKPASPKPLAPTRKRKRRGRYG